MLVARVLVLGLVSVVTQIKAHVGHGDDGQAKNAIQDALLAYLCRGANGFPCNGHGGCSGGVCTCFQGYSGLKCERNDADLDFGMMAPELPVDSLNFDQTDLSQPGVTFRHPPASDNDAGLSLRDLLPPSSDNIRNDIIACLDGDENACSGNGFCRGGTCVCEPGYSGIICELHAEVGFCRTYKDCAECTAFMTTCPQECNLMATFKLVYGFPKDPSGTFRQCRFRNSNMNCSFYFKQESEDEYGHKVIMVKACLATQDSTTNFSEPVEQIIDKPTLPMTESTQPTASVKTPAPTQPPGMDPHDGHHHPHDEDSGDSGKQSGSGNGNGSRASFVHLEATLLLGVLLFCYKYLTNFS